MDLTAPQLEAIQRLISEPLRLAVRAEMQAGHERLAAAVEKLADQFAAHVAETLRRDRARDTRLESLEQRVAALERFRGKVLIVYGVLTIALSFCWSVVREWMLAIARRK
jgi:hypothetical protein